MTGWSPLSPNPCRSSPKPLSLKRPISVIFELKNCVMASSVASVVMLPTYRRRLWRASEPIGAPGPTPPPKKRGGLTPPVPNEPGVALIVGRLWPGRLNMPEWVLRQREAKGGERGDAPVILACSAV